MLDQSQGYDMPSDRRCSSVEDHLQEGMRVQKQIRKLGASRRSLGISRIKGIGNTDEVSKVGTMEYLSIAIFESEKVSS